MLNNFPTMLAIETATSACSVALLVDGQHYLKMQVGSNIHSQVLLEMVDEVLLAAGISVPDIDLVVVGQGPGSFTGLRIGIGVAQGLAYGAGCQMLGISSLDALAQQSTSDGNVIAGIDARMGEAYWCEYEKTADGLQRLGELKVTKPEEIITTSQSPVLVGNAWAEHWPQLSEILLKDASHLDTVIYPTAAALLQLAELRLAVEKADQIMCSPIDFAPEYVRDDVAKKKANGFT